MAATPQRKLSALPDLLLLLIGKLIDVRDSSPLSGILQPSFRPPNNVFHTILRSLITLAYIIIEVVVPELDNSLVLLTVLLLLTPVGDARFG